MNGRTIRMCSVIAVMVLNSLWAQEKTHVSLQQILSNQAVWGKDLQTALADTSAWQKVGEHQVVIFPTMVQGSTTKENSTEEHKLTTEMQQALKSVGGESRKEIWSLLKCDSDGHRAFCEKPGLVKTQQVQVVKEHGESHVAAMSKDLQFLSPDATVDTLKREFGPPERISQEVIQGKYERRPVVLTKYEYANGQVEFATSNMRPGGQLDRVFVDAAAVSNSMSESGKK